MSHNPVNDKIVASDNGVMNSYQEEEDVAVGQFGTDHRAKTFRCLDMPF